MKKIAAILFMGALLYNCIGYRMLYAYLQHHADTQLEARIDRDDFDESRLIEIKVPLNLPYQSDWDEFQRIEGEIELEGKHYKYLKMKYSRDSLVLVCLPDDNKQKIEKEKGEFFKLVNGIQQNSKTKQDRSSQSFLKTLLSEYQDEQNNWKNNFFIDVPHSYYINYSDRYSSTFTTTPHHPPNHSC